MMAKTFIELAIVLAVMGDLELISRRVGGRVKCKMWGRTLIGAWSLRVSWLRANLEQTPTDNFDRTCLNSGYPCLARGMPLRSPCSWVTLLLLVLFAECQLGRLEKAAVLSCFLSSRFASLLI